MEEILSLKHVKEIHCEEAHCTKQMETRIGGNYFIGSEESLSALKLGVNLCTNICRQFKED